MVVLRGDEELSKMFRVTEINPLTGTNLHQKTMHQTKLHHTTLHHTTLHQTKLPTSNLHHRKLHQSNLHSIQSCLVQIWLVQIKPWSNDVPISKYYGSDVCVFHIYIKYDSNVAVTCNTTYILQSRK